MNKTPEIIRAVVLEYGGERSLQLIDHLDMNPFLEPVIAASETFALEDDPIDEFSVSLPPPVFFEGSHYPKEEDESEIPTEALRRHLAVLEAQKYLRWIEHIKPGASRMYHVGNLAIDRETDKHAALLGTLFLRASDHGLVMLVQRYWNESRRSLEYYAYRTSKDIMPFHLRGLQTIIEEFENVHP